MTLTAKIAISPHPMRLLFLVSAENELSRRALIELTDRGHQVAVAVAGSPAEMEAAVHTRRPQLIVCPFLKTLIPESIWSEYRCLIVHPGPWGDRGSSSADWSIEVGIRKSGVSVVEASGEADAGTVWATRAVPAHETGQSTRYGYELRRHAIEALVEAIDRIARDTAPDVALRAA